jgi:hypothetical protein
MAVRSSTPVGVRSVLTRFLMLAERFDGAPSTFPHLQRVLTGIGCTAAVADMTPERQWYLDVAMILAGMDFTQRAVLFRHLEVVSDATLSKNRWWLATAARVSCDLSRRRGTATFVTASECQRAHGEASDVLRAEMRDKGLAASGYLEQPDPAMPPGAIDRCAAAERGEPCRLNS